MPDDKHGWNHPQCYFCWYRHEGVTREPTRVSNDSSRQCCYCGRVTNAGIYRRQRPGDTLIPYCLDLPGAFRVAGANGPPQPPTGPQAP